MISGLFIGGRTGVREEGGLTLLHRIRVRSGAHVASIEVRNLPVIAMTGTSIEPQPYLAQNGGADAVLKKPVMRADLLLPANPPGTRPFTVAGG